MADIETKRSWGPHSYTAPVVETKANLQLATAWVEQPDLHCDSVTLRCNGLSEATFTYHAGKSVLQIGGTAFEPSANYSTGTYVRVTHGDFVWRGYLEGSRLHRKTSRNVQLSAYGLEYWLDRQQVGASVIYPEKRLGRGVGFNSSGASMFNTTPNKRGNMSIGNNGSGVRVFANEIGSVEEWNAYEMLRYLLHYFGPYTAAGAESPCPYVLHSSAEQFLQDYKPAFNPYGKTFYQILNELVNPKRGLCWWLDYDELAFPAGTATIYVQSLWASEVELPGGGSIPANTNKASIDFDDDETVIADRFSKIRRGKYSRCVARGARITSTATFYVGDELEPDWDSDEETAYLAGASGTTGYAGLSTDDKAARNDAFRRQEQFYRVYCAFRVPSDWDGVAGEIMFPESLLGGSDEESLTYHANWLRFLPKTLLNRGWDYQDVTNPVSTTPTGSGPELMPPLAFVRVATSPNLHQYIDKLNHADYADGTKESDQFTASYHLYVQQDCPGIVLRPSNGLNHMLAKGNWSGNEPTGSEPEVDYTSLLVTASMEADHYAQGQYPEAPEAGQYEELLIQLGDDYRLDYVVPGTVVGLSNGVLVDTAAGGILRDDRNQLKDIARLAYEWYQSEQQTLNITWAQIGYWLERGMMLTTIGGTDPETANTVVGSITYNFASETTSLQTIGDEFNVAEVLS